jgi:hypothetical protein
MLGYYSPLLVLQAFCLYHAYQRRVEQRWYWIIFFLPGLGCLLYLYDAFYSRRNVSSLAEGVKHVVNRNYRIEQLEKAVRFSENVTNKTQLADAYAHAGRYAEAVEVYQSCLRGFMAGDPDIRMKVLQASYLQGDYATAIAFGDGLEKDGEKVFANADARVSHAWAHFHAGDAARAEAIFRAMDKTHTNYFQRAEYCRFLREANRPEPLKHKLEELLGEFEYLKGNERRTHRRVIVQVKELYRGQP